MYFPSTIVTGPRCQRCRDSPVNDHWLVPNASNVNDVLTLDSSLSVTAAVPKHDQRARPLSRTEDFSGARMRRFSSPHANWHSSIRANESNSARTSTCGISMALQRNSTKYALP